MSCSGSSSRITYGTGDFFGGLAARRVPVLWVVFLSHALAAVLVVAVVGLDRNAHPTREDIVIGIVAGIDRDGLGRPLLQRVSAIGRMGVVAPITAVVSAIVPVAWGLGSASDPRRLALIGVALAIGSVALISSDAGDSPHGPVTRSRTPLYLALGAGLGFGAFFVLYSNAGDRARACGLCSRLGGPPRASSHSCSPSSLAPDATLRRAELSRSSPAPGLFDAAANGFFLAAARTRPALHRRRRQLALPGEHGALGAGCAP